jgi:UDP-N-acetylmuramoyl-tripeptide--D-alanyl-D-alanine ligase
MPGPSFTEIARTVGGSIVSGQMKAGGIFEGGYAFDSRLLKPGDLFFALKGEVRDGREFVASARARGAAAAVVSHKVDGLPDDFIQIAVESTLDALQQLAIKTRDGIRIPVIAISGSNGKTTTKEMLAHILSGTMKVFKSPGNFNNHIGVPLTILGAPRDSKVLVMELGSNHRGEIARLARIARPHVGVLTNVGRAHIGFFGSLEETAREKSDVLRHLEPGGTGVVNADDRLLAGALDDIEAGLVTFGIERTAQFMAAGVKPLAGGGSTFNVGAQEFRIKVPGFHNVYNALAATAAASLLEVGVPASAEALETFEPFRVKKVSAGSITIMDDSYNANPDSVKAAADILSAMPASRRIFILGEMLELGSESERLHMEVGQMLAASGADIVIGIGGMTRSTVASALSAGMAPDSALFFETKADAQAHIADAVRDGDVILVKGSRLAGLEEICEFLKSTAEGRV